MKKMISIMLVFFIMIVFSFSGISFTRDVYGNTDSNDTKDIYKDGGYNVTINQARVLTHNKSFQYWTKNYKSPSTILAETGKEENLKVYSELYQTLTENLMKDPEKYTNFYKIVLMDILTNNKILQSFDDYRNSAYRDLKDTLTSEVASEMHMDWEILSSKSMSNDMVKKIQSINNYAGIKYIDLMQLGKKNIEDFISEAANVLALSQVSNDMIISLNQIKQNTTNKDLISGIDDIIELYEKSEENIIKACIDQGLEKGWENITDYFKNLAFDALLVEMGLSPLKAGYDAGKLISNVVLSTNEITQKYLMMYAASEIELCLEKAIARDAALFKQNISTQNATTIIAEAKFYKQLLLYSCQVSKEFVDAVYKKNLWQKFFSSRSDKSTYQEMKDLLKSSENRITNVDFSLDDSGVLGNPVPYLYDAIGPYFVTNDFGRDPMVFYCYNGSKQEIYFDKSGKQPIDGKNNILMINGFFMGNDSVEVIDNISFIAIRVIEDNLGYSVNWDDRKQQITINAENKIQLTINRNHAYMDDKMISLTASPRMIQGVPYVSARDISNILHLNLSYYPNGLEEIINIISLDDGNYFNQFQSNAEVEKHVREKLVNAIDGFLLNPELYIKGPGYGSYDDRDKQNLITARDSLYNPSLPIQIIELPRAYKVKYYYQDIFWQDEDTYFYLWVDKTTKEVYFQFGCSGAVAYFSLDIMPEYPIYLYFFTC